MRLIDADALKENMFYHTADNVMYAEERDIDAMPTIDAVTVTEIEKAIERYKGYAKKHSENLNFTMTSVFAAAAAALMELIKENADADN